MSAKIDLACMVCTEEFLVTAEDYFDGSRTPRCPCCGSLDVVTLVDDESAA
jgi:hypothetical protein